MKPVHIQDVYAYDLYEMLIGDLIAQGEFRKVYECRTNPNLVIKIDQRTNPNYNSNFKEQEAYFHALLDKTGLDSWMAPCVAISSLGLFLIQERTEPVPYSKLPKYVPAFFCDTKRSNWGMLKDQIVFHDYAGHNAHSYPKQDLTKLVKADWLNT
jgi:hypothetical protein